MPVIFGQHHGDILPPDASRLMDLQDARLRPHRAGFPGMPAERPTGFLPEERRAGYAKCASLAPTEHGALSQFDHRFIVTL